MFVIISRGEKTNCEIMQKEKILEIKNLAGNKSKWTSIVNHLVNIHTHEGNKIFLKCGHDDLDREWI